MRGSDRVPKELKGSEVAASAPGVGDWFLLTEEVSGLASYKEPRAWHPFLVRSTWPGPRVLLLPRSTTWPEGRAHKAHDGTCGPSACRIDEDGCIDGSSPVSVDTTKLDRFSCHEPDDELIDWAMRSTPRPAPDTTRRGRR